MAVSILDDVDRRLLRYLQTDPDMSLAELADRANVPLPTVKRRVRRLYDREIIQGVSEEIDWAAAGFAVEVSLRVSLDKSEPTAFDAFIAAARDVPEVIEIQTFLGRVDVRLSAIARDMGHYQQVYRDRILTLPHIADIEALMHVTRIKSAQALPI